MQAADSYVAHGFAASQYNNSESFIIELSAILVCNF